ncbi:protein Son isoform X2 [Harmonia axyridis]|uniref:protein Son isoform X2 n=1 Tax=Harmonia axyridis TaxID=115357 RepID=UPI001E274F4D|nr:protein Son isoform X2 [Harmonia axyridis]
MEQDEKDTKPVVETKSSMEILSELFSTFDADPPVLIEDELSNGTKKHKKKSKNKSKDKKHKKKSKKRKHSRSCSSSNSSSELDFDLSKLLVKREQSAEKKIKIEGTELSLSLDKIHETEPKEEVDVKPHIDELTKENDNEDGELSSDDEVKHHSKHKKRKRHKHKKDKSQEKTKKYSDKLSDDISDSSKQKHHHRSTSRHKSSKEKEEMNDFYKNKDDSRSERNRSRSPHKYSDLRQKIKENVHKHSSSSHKDGCSSPHRYSDSRHKTDYRSNRLGRHDDFYKVRDKDRSYDRSNKDDFYRSRSNDRNRDDSWFRSREHSRDSKYRDRRYSSTNDSSYIDKKKLLEIARKNAIQMMKSGNLPGALSLGPQAQEKVIAAIKAGGKTIEELTDFCKTLATKEDLGQLSEVEDDKASDSDNDKLFNHPFQIKDRPTTITMNIKNSVPLPVKSTQERTTELRMQFPVSSGQHHRKNENEWVPVESKKDVTPAPKPSIALTKEMVPITPLVPATSSAQFLSTVPAPVPIPPSVQQQIDIGAIVSQRLSAMRKLQENPNDVQALSQMYQSTKEVQTWAESKQQPGQFTGAVEGNFLTHSELSSGYQAWAKKANSDSLLGQGFKRKTVSMDRVIGIGSTTSCRSCFWRYGNAFTPKNGLEAR